MYLADSKLNPSNSDKELKIIAVQITIMSLSNCNYAEENSIIKNWESFLSKSDSLPVTHNAIGQNLLLREQLLLPHKSSTCTFSCEEHVRQCYVENANLINLRYMLK